MHFRLKDMKLVTLSDLTFIVSIRTHYISPDNLYIFCRFCHPNPLRRCRLRLGQAGKKGAMLDAAHSLIPGME